MSGNLCASDRAVLPLFVRQWLVLIRLIKLPLNLQQVEIRLAAILQLTNLNVLWKLCPCMWPILILRFRGEPIGPYSVLFEMFVHTCLSRLMAMWAQAAGAGSVH